VTRKRSLMETAAAVVAPPSDPSENESAGESSSSMRPCEQEMYFVQRAGKWSADEEKLASLLVSDFENGSLEDCPDGTTLRSYLARKLNCAPMRISKKFAGRCIGKVPYECILMKTLNFFSVSPTVGSRPSFPFTFLPSYSALIHAPRRRAVVVEAAQVSLGGCVASKAVVPATAA